MQSANAERIEAAAARAQAALLDRRAAGGWWVGQLSTSALSTATAVMALLQAVQAAEADASELAGNDQQLRLAAPRWRALAVGGLQWLSEHQNADGGFGDTVLSVSNISTTMLVHAVFHFAAGLGCSDPAGRYPQVCAAAAAYVQRAGGVPALLQRYGRDRTFSVPILTHCALAGIVDWREVIPLPFELACVPQKFYAALRLPVVSYALPALIAIGQVIFRKQGHWNPLLRWLRNASIQRSLKVLESIQPVNGGFLEATPLTSFVCMSLIGCGLLQHPVVQKCLQFIESSVRSDGSWPIDTNLTTWVTTLSVNALQGAVDQDWRQCVDVSAVRNWLMGQQYRVVHPYTGAAPGGWSWTDLPGGVPDADDTPGAMLAVLNLRGEAESYSQSERASLLQAGTWLLGLQNRDGGWPTFCRGWGALPFDRSSCDLTAHVLRAFQLWNQRLGFPDPQFRKSMDRGVSYLLRQQRGDGTWLPLWFGNQFHRDDENPLYGTTRVLRAFASLDLLGTVAAERGVRWLVQNQNEDGGWSAVRGISSTVEETGLALEVLSEVAGLGGELGELARGASDRAAMWLALRVEAGTVEQPSPIGFYFAKLWYFEALYPLIFAVSGLNRWTSVRKRTKIARMNMD
ncbi:MAG: Squalene--hopene cyclase [Planctomycetota bacterium]|jgi:squalene-hopene/tetraprenyl-beta-curcumene cyclase